MKKWFALLLCLTLLCSCLSAGAQSPDPAELFPTPSISMVEYMNHHAVTMRQLDPSYTGRLYMIPGLDGHYVLTDGVTKEDVTIFEWTVQGNQLVGITVSIPNDIENLETAANIWSIMSIYAAMPLAMRDGMSAEEAYNACHQDLFTMMSGDVDDPTASVYGMQANVSRDADAIRMHYTIHVVNPTPACETPALGMPSFTAFRDSADACLTSALSQTPAWSAPVESDGNQIISIPGLGNNPLLYYRDDQLLMATVMMPLDPENPLSTVTNVQTLTSYCLLAPMLMAHGMSIGEVNLVLQQYGDTIGFSYQLVSAINGIPFSADFYGVKLSAELKDSMGEPTLYVYLIAWPAE